MPSKRTRRYIINKLQRFKEQLLAFQPTIGCAVLIDVSRLFIYHLVSFEIHLSER